MDNVRCNARGASGTSPASGSLSSEDVFTALFSFNSARRIKTNLINQNHCSLQVIDPFSLDSSPSFGISCLPFVFFSSLSSSSSPPSDNAPSSDTLPSRFR